MISLSPVLYSQVMCILLQFPSYFWCLWFIELLGPDFRVFIRFRKSALISSNILFSPCFAFLLKGLEWHITASWYFVYTFSVIFSSFILPIFHCCVLSFNHYSYITHNLPLIPSSILFILDIVLISSCLILVFIISFMLLLNMFNLSSNFLNMEYGYKNHFNVIVC